MATRSNGEIEKNVVMCRELWYIIGTGKTIEPKAALPLLFFPHSQRYHVSDKGRRIMNSLIEVNQKYFPEAMAAQ